MGIRNFWNAITGLAGAGGVAAFRDRAEAEMGKAGARHAPGRDAVARLQTTPPGRGVNMIMKRLSAGQKLRLLPTLLRTMNVVTRCGTYMRDPSRDDARRIPSEGLYAELRELALREGASSVGFTTVADHDIFREYAIPYRNVVVFAIEMNRQRMETAPGFGALREVLGTYGALGDVALVVSDHLRELGYDAYPGFPIGGAVDYVRVAEQAGLGAIGYHGMLIAPENGSRIRLDVVFTSLDVPSPPAENPHRWVREFCEQCRQCVRSCPPGAIFTEGEPNARTGRKKTVRYDACLEQYAKNHGCAVCVKECPFSRAGYSTIREGFERSRARARLPLIT